MLLLSAVFLTKQDTSQVIAENMVSHGLKIDKKKVEAILNFDTKRLEIRDDEESKAARAELTSLTEYFLAICEQNSDKDREGECVKIVDNIYELEKVYRQHLMMYNADVLGYNFWIEFFPTAFI